MKIFCLFVHVHTKMNISVYEFKKYKFRVRTFFCVHTWNISCTCTKKQHIFCTCTVFSVHKKTAELLSPKAERLDLELRRLDGIYSAILQREWSKTLVHLLNKRSGTRLVTTHKILECHQRYRNRFVVVTTRFVVIAARFYIKILM